MNVARLLGFRGGASLLACVFVGWSATGIAFAAGADQDRCASLADLPAAGTTFTLASLQEAGDFTSPTGSVLKGLPAFCRLAATLTPTETSNIRVELWLPTQGWNGRYLGLGNGGYAGSLDYVSLAEGLKRGFAVAHTDMGTSPSTGMDGSSLFGYPEKWIDWGYRSTHLMTILAKRMIAKFYGRAPNRSYFLGCSTGGGQAVHEMTRYPEDYDGLVAGAPGNNRLEAHIAVKRYWEVFKKTPGSWLTAEKLKLLSDAVIKKCGAQDGVANGLVSRPESCDFKPEELLCASGDASNCLSTAQVAAVNEAYAGASDPTTGELIAPGLLKGSEPGWTKWVGAAEPNASIPYGAIFTWVFGKDFDWRTFNYARDVKIMRTVLGPMLNALDPNVSSFRDRGGKIIFYQGLADALVSPTEVTRYVKNVERTVGNGSNFLRLFFAPGMDHCRGGYGPNMFGNGLTNTVAAHDPAKDVLSAVVEWTEKGIAPDRIVATQFENNDPVAGNVVRTRPLCPYPAVAKYAGSGDPNDAASFTCGANTR